MNVEWKGLGIGSGFAVDYLDLMTQTPYPQDACLFCMVSDTWALHPTHASSKPLPCQMCIPGNNGGAQ